MLENSRGHIKPLMLEKSQTPARNNDQKFKAWIWDVKKKQMSRKSQIIVKLWRSRMEDKVNKDIFFKVYKEIRHNELDDTNVNL